MEINEIHSKFLECKSVSIDTRKIESDSLFVAIKGDNFDANTFAQEALNKGAKYVIIDNNDYFINQRTILVNDSLKTLQDLAKYHRNYLKLPVLALTGSNGKTTTKELINVVLSKKYNTKATIGNLNNHIGVPLTLLSFTNDTQIGIVEMGANHQKEIEFLCDIAQPDFGYVTNFGKAHLEGFGGVEGVIKGKSEMYQYLQANNKKVFVNLDDEIQNIKTNSLDRITFSSINKNSNLFITKISANPFVTIEFENVKVNSKLIGFYNANNINAAIVIGKFFGINNALIKEAIENYTPDNNRSQLINKGSNKIILDAYNANPSSMKVALENFIQLDNNNKIAIIGDMFELGDESKIEHQAIVDFLIPENTNSYFFIGKTFFDCKIKQENFIFFNSFEDFSVYLKTNQFKNKTILIKGSRGMALERTLELL
jgi:UDP-N-acetylmuramoyl-tripeptide--D-alanyl-D-alanine ligase